MITCPYCDEHHRDGDCHQADPDQQLRPARPASGDHPGGPLSRAERVVLSNLKGGTMRARAIVGGLTHILGAVPGAQKIEAAQAEAVAAIDHLLATMKQRKEGAPYPAGQEPAVGTPSPEAPSDG